MAQVIFSFKGFPFPVQCNTNDSMGDIINKFKTKRQIKDDKNIFFLYNGEAKINYEDTFMQQANEIDKERKEMNIIVNMDEEEENNTIITSKDIICPLCNKILLIEMNNFKINLAGCKHEDQLNNLSVFKFEETQKIDLLKVICNECKKCNKFGTYKNTFYVCYTCNKYLCPSCKDKHDNNHIIINEDLKNHTCKKHKELELFCKYCENCKQDLCVLCEKEHYNHNLIDLGKIILIKDELLNDNENLKNLIDIFKYRSKLMIEILNNMMNIMDSFYKINNDLINNFNESRRNYNSFKNLYYMQNNTNKLKADLENIINYSDQDIFEPLNKLSVIEKYLEIFKFSFNNFYSQNGEKYLGEMKNGLKNGNGIIYYGKDDSAFFKGIYEGEWKDDKREGKGIMFLNNYWTEAQKYEGEWKNDKREGKGSLICKNGNVYEGEWKEDKKNGKGKMVWNNGADYEGEWKDDKKDGKGIMIWNNGEL